MSTKLNLILDEMTLPSATSARTALETAMRDKQPLSLWLDKHGNLVALRFTDGDVAESPSSKPAFPVCIAIKGRLLDNDGNPMSLNLLSKAVKTAEAERTRFYTEQENRFGPSAWPRNEAE